MPSTKSVARVDPLNGEEECTGGGRGKMHVVPRWSDVWKIRVIPVPLEPDS